jgi:hypothetical protein
MMLLIEKYHLETAVSKPCNMRANQSRRDCVWAQTYYLEQRKRGKSHACALRCLGQRWLKILWKMWQENTPYDETRHTRNQVQHGSWVIQFKPA